MRREEFNRIIRIAGLHKRSYSDNVVGKAEKSRVLNDEVLKRFREVKYDSAKQKAYTRLTAYPERVLVGKVESEHNVAQLVLNYFMNKFPAFFIVLFSDYGLVYGSKKIKVSLQPSGETNEEIVNHFRRIVGDKIKELKLRHVQTSKITDKLWNTYYDSQYIPARKNLKNMNKCIYDKRKINDAKEYLKKRENKSLEDF